MLVDGGGIGALIWRMPDKGNCCESDKDCADVEMHTHGARLPGLEDEAEPEKPSLMLLVTCIAEFDPTRIRPLDANGQPVLRPLRSADSCRLRAGGNVDFLVGQRRLMQ